MQLLVILKPCINKQKKNKAYSHTPPRIGMLIFYQSIGGGLVNTFINKRIGLFLASQNISLFGSQLVSYAIIWYITLETSSGGWLTMITVCSMMPQALISLWGGVLADRYNKKTLIILSDTFIGIATLILVVAFISALNCQIKCNTLLKKTS